jgi:hypothetical protein
MSHANVLRFLSAAHANGAMRSSYDQRNLSQLLFHAKNDGFEFTAADVADVVGTLEASTILTKDQDPFDATSRLWRHMWGRYHLAYVIDHVLRRHTDAELHALIGELETRDA